MSLLWPLTCINSVGTGQYLYVIPFGVALLVMGGRPFRGQSMMTHVEAYVAGAVSTYILDFKADINTDVIDSPPPQA